MSMEKNFKEKLYDLETPLGGNVSFDKVMAMRRKKGAPIWWKPAILVVATMSAVTLTGFFWFGNGFSSSAKTATPPAVAKSNPNPHSSKSGNSVSENSAANAQSDKSTSTLETGVARVASPKRLKRKVSKAAQSSDASIRNSTNIRVQTPSEILEAPVEAASLWSHSGLFGIGLRKHPFVFAINGVVHMEPATRHKDPFTPSPMIPDFVELMMYTGTQNYNKFQSDKDFSIRGNHKSAQYSAVALWNMAHGIQLGAGIGYGQIAGNGVWRENQVKQEVTISSRVVTVYQPGMPPKYVTVYDTAINTVKTSQTGDVQYTATKLSIPLALRMNIGEGRMLFRLSATVSPGLLTQATGVAFNRESHSTMLRNTHSFVLDSRLGAGLYYTISPRMALIAEPSVNLQHIQGVQAMGKFNYGLGFGILIKP
jgi:hypothetical protein